MYWAYVTIFKDDVFCQCCGNDDVDATFVEKVRESNLVKEVHTDKIDSAWVIRFTNGRLPHEKQGRHSFLKPLEENFRVEKVFFTVSCDTTDVVEAWAYYHDTSSQELVKRLYLREDNSAKGIVVDNNVSRMAGRRPYHRFHEDDDE